MKMNRVSAIVLAVMMMFVMTACNGKTETVNAVPEEKVDAGVKVETEQPQTPSVEKVDIAIGTLKGPTGMGMVGLMDQADQGTSKMNYTFEILSTPDEMVGKVVSGEVDIAAVPTNMALLLNNKTEGKLQLAAINTLGVLYVLENGESIQSIQDLAGKTIHLSGKGASPDYVLQYLIKESGVENVTIDYSLEHADLAAAMAAGDVSIGLLPEPFVTTALMNQPELRVALDLTKEWEQIEDNGTLAMGVIVAQKAFVEAHPEAFETFLEEYKASVSFVNAEQEKASALIEQYGILPKAAVAKKAIKGSNIVFMEAQEGKATLEQFYKILFDFNPKSIGGKLADESFYYERVNP